MRPSAKPTRRPRASPPLRAPESASARKPAKPPSKALAARAALHCPPLPALANAFHAARFVVPALSSLPSPLLAPAVASSRQSRLRRHACTRARPHRRPHALSHARLRRAERRVLRRARRLRAADRGPHADRQRQHRAAAFGHDGARTRARAAFVDERGDRKSRRPLAERGRQRRPADDARLDDEARHHLERPRDARRRLPLEDLGLHRRRSRCERHAARQSLHQGHRRSETRARRTDRPRAEDPRVGHHAHRRRARARQERVRSVHARPALVRRRRQRALQRRPRSADVRVQVGVVHVLAVARRRLDRRGAAGRAMADRQPDSGAPRRVPRHAAEPAGHARRERRRHRQLRRQLRDALRRAHAQHGRARRSLDVLRRRLPRALATGGRQLLGRDARRRRAAARAPRGRAPEPAARRRRARHQQVQQQRDGAQSVPHARRGRGQAAFNHGEGRVGGDELPAPQRPCDARTRARQRLRPVARRAHQRALAREPAADGQREPGRAGLYRLAAGRGRGRHDAQPPDQRGRGRQRAHQDRHAARCARDRGLRGRRERFELDRREPDQRSARGRRARRSRCAARMGLQGHARGASGVCRSASAQGVEGVARGPRRESRADQRIGRPQAGGKGAGKSIGKGVAQSLGEGACEDVGQGVRQGHEEASRRALSVTLAHADGTSS
ncbi:hypothetical protein PT2222_270077 [Paraburkholderia tropica]